MSAKLLQATDLPGGYKLWVWDSGHSNNKEMYIDAELANMDWIAFAGRVGVPINVDPKTNIAASFILDTILAGKHYSLTDDQRDFLNSTEAFKLKAWCDVNR